MNSASAPGWVTDVSALLTPAIAILVAVIAYRQWRTAHYRLKLDMFEKRYAIHAATRDLMATIVTSGQVDNAKLVDFVYGIRQARWLLGKDVAHYLDGEMYRRALDLQSLISEEKNLTSDALAANIRNQHEIRAWISKQYDVLDAKFDKYLKIPSDGMMRRRCRR